MRILMRHIAASVVLTLRVRGHDVLVVKESMRGEEDTAILARAQAESRLVVTQDKDFGELAFRAGLPRRAASFSFGCPATTRKRNSPSWWK